MDQYIGKLLDNRYELLERIGTGGMAVVYKARCHRLNRLVAVKILKPELAQDAEFRRRFHDESQAVAMLSHPNIMAVYDVSRSDDLDYIVMELLDGITLKQYMQKKGLPLNWREALHFITQIMKALSHAHSRGIIHRDIKPQNIMVLRDGSVKVADFGIARVASAAQSTLTQEALGSVHYISPEQARGSHIDTRADIYSAGVVLYEMTAGRLPYEGDTPVSVAIQHISSIPLPPRDINPDIPEALEAINMKAMASDVDKRYVSADAMLADLEEFRKNPSINFEYTQEDLFCGGVVDEPTIVRGSGEDAGVLRRAEEGGSRRQNENGKSRRRRRDYDEDDEDDYYDDRRDRGSVWPVILAIFAILIFFVGIGYFLWTAVFGGILSTQSTEVIVPNLVGMTVQEVNREISFGTINEVFTIVEGDTVVSDLPAGQIVNQDPLAGDKKKGEEIIITVDISLGPEQILMPNVAEMEYRNAITKLRDEMGLTVRTEYENSEDIARNYVIRSEPLEGVDLEEGQEVVIVISLGAKTVPVTIPVFTGSTIDWALEQVEILNLSIGSVDEKVDTTHEKGTVIYQSIPANTQVEEGTKISFHISSGPTDDENPTDDSDIDNEPDVSVSEAPEVTPPLPDDETTVSTKSKVVQVDLSPYTEQVSIRVEVDGVVQHNSLVNPVDMSVFYKNITGTGVQRVVVFVDNVIVQNYLENFEA